jgi:mannose-6-phosphate isomerase-like protein (cupin superfamily)
MALSKGIRRVVTTHDQAGKAVIGFDGIADVSGGEPELGVESITLWVTDGTPADISGSKDTRGAKVGIPPPKNGSIFRIVDFHPTPNADDLDPNFLAKIVGQKRARGAKPPRHPGMHRTRSIDYLAVLSGEIDMLLDEGEVHLKAGDVMVQRGTMHAWVNRGKEVCRIAAAMIDAKEPGRAKTAKPKKSRAVPARKASSRTGKRAGGRKR